MVGVQRESLTHQTGAAIIELIRASKLRVGDRLPSINDIADDIGVSSAGAREAIAELAGLGLIERKQGAGNVLALPGSANIARIYSMRFMLKRVSREHLQEFTLALMVAACRLATQRADEESMALLSSRLDDLRSAESAGDFYVADVLFCLAIAQVGGNDLLLESLRALTPRSGEQMDAGWPHRGPNCWGDVDQQVRIYEAIREHKEDAAARLMEDHLRR